MAVFFVVKPHVFAAQRAAADRIGRLICVLFVACTQCKFVDKIDGDGALPSAHFAIFQIFQIVFANIIDDAFEFARRFELRKIFFALKNSCLALGK